MDHFFENFTTLEFAEFGRLNWQGNCIFTIQELKDYFFALLAK